MKRSQARVGTIWFVVVVVACGGSNSPGQGQVDTTQARGPQPTAPRVDSIARDSSAIRQVPIVTVASDTLPLVSVADVLGSAAWVGRRVRVEGTCIGYSRVLAAGPQPRSRSDWQLVSDSVAIWVAGSYPAGCAGTIPSTAPATYVVEVAADTLPGLGGQPGRARRYLVYTAQR